MRKFPILLLGVVACCIGRSVVADDQPSTIDQASQDRSLQEMNDTLTKARAVPNFENGQPAGYKTFQPQQGGTYQKLGLKNGDVIKTVDGQAVNDPTKAFEMLSAKSHTELQVERDGQTRNIQTEQADDGDRVPASSN